MFNIISTGQAIYLAKHNVTLADVMANSQANEYTAFAANLPNVGGGSLPSQVGQSGKYLTTDGNTARK